MAKRMLIDATHPEETRVVVLNGNRLEEFDFESSTKRQVKGNIYLAKVTRVEPSLQAAFVEYGGNRHGFLAFSEIHPDYYRIPVSDRREIATDPQPPDGEEAEFAAEAGDESGVPLEEALPEPVTVTEASRASGDLTEGEFAADPVWEGDGGEPVTSPEVNDETTARDAKPVPAEPTEPLPHLVQAQSPVDLPRTPSESPSPLDLLRVPPEAAEPPHDFGHALADPAQPPPLDFVQTASEPGEFLTPSGPMLERPEAEQQPEPSLLHFDIAVSDNGPSAVPITGWSAASAGDEIILATDDIITEDEDRVPRLEAAMSANGENVDAEVIETLGGDDFEEAEHQRSRALRHYKIQEVIKRRQIMLVQVTKEERGNKGAALTTYLSLAGRYCVLMPNTARGGGVSRKITSLSDRRRLKEILAELDIPEGMGVIVRTAGGERSKAEIKRDYEYLLRLWNEIRELTLRSTAPAVIYEEGDLIKRSIRDLYTRDIDEVLVEGEEGYRTAKAFMKMLMPSHAKRVQPYRDPQIGLLHRFQVESQIDAIHSPIVQLRSGGYIVIDQTEALVAIDVNSGRSTRERNIEETALRTNLEAAEEIARQLRLRDLAGLIVIDFIDMEEHRNQAAVERRLKEALKSDRARIQVGRISPFGLLEMSRQRLRPSLVEASTQPCPHCGGTGFIRSTESTALFVLRSIEEEGMRRRSAEVCVYVPTTVALYILNHKRESLARLETRYGIHVLVARDDGLIPPAFRLERLRAYEPGEGAAVAAPVPLTQAPEIDAEEEEDETEESFEVGDAEPTGRESEDDRAQARRRRRRRRRHEDERSRVPSSSGSEEMQEAAAESGAGSAGADADHDEEDGDGGRLRRRRGRRGGRRRGRREDSAESSREVGRPAAEIVEIVATGANDPDGDGDAVEFEEIRPAAVAETMSVEELVIEPVTATIATAIETANSPARRGDAMADNDLSPVVVVIGTPSTEATIAEQGSPPRPGGESRGNGVSPPSEPWSAPASDDSAADRSVEQRVAALPPASEASSAWSAPASDNSEADRSVERVAAPLPASEASPARQVETPQKAELGPDTTDEPGQIVQEVTKKPENPRRGWWQRLIQS